MKELAISIWQRRCAEHQASFSSYFKSMIYPNLDTGIVVLLQNGLGYLIDSKVAYASATTAAVEAV